MRRWIDFFEGLFLGVLVGVCILIAGFLFVSLAEGEEITGCPTGLKQCFQCQGQSTTFVCCLDPTSATGQVCAKQNCAGATVVDCSGEVNEWKEKAVHPNGQLYSEHWGACKTTVFQLWHALHGTTP